MRVKGQSILVTGAGNGIGEGIAKRMAEARRMRQAAPIHDPNFVLLGEPLPGRSALAMKRATAPAAPVKNISLASCVADTSNLWNEHA